MVSRPFQHGEMWEVVLSINICVLLSVTGLFIGCVCCARQRNQVPVIYYTNLLISSLIQSCSEILWLQIPFGNTMDIFYYCAVMAGLYFKMCMALERYFFIACPLLDCLRQTQGSVLLCVLVWSFCIVSVTLAIILDESVFLIIYAALPAPLFIICLAGTFRALPAATSVPTEEKRRIVGTLVLLLLNYSLVELPAVIILTLNLLPPPHPYADFVYITVTYIPLALFLDLILYGFKYRGPIDKLLAITFWCSMENSSNADVTDVSTERRVHVGRDEELERDERTPSSTNIVSE